MPLSSVFPALFLDLVTRYTVQDHSPIKAFLCLSDPHGKAKRHFHLEWKAYKTQGWREI